MARKANSIRNTHLQKWLRDEPNTHPMGDGMYFRVTPAGTGLFAQRYSFAGKRRMMSIGTYSENSDDPNCFNLERAKLRAAEIRCQVANGIDPLAERKRPKATQMKTVDDLAQDWLENDIQMRLKHPHIPARIYRKEIAPHIGELIPEHVTPSDIRGIINAVVKSKRPTTANDTLMYCKQLFRHGINFGPLVYNPADAFTIHHAGGIEESRSRALTIPELKVIFQVFRDNIDQFTRDNYLVVALLLTLGVRKGELIGAKWAEFDLQKRLWDIPKDRSKTGVALTIPLPTIAIEWLEELHIRAFNSEYVLPNRRRSKRFNHISPDTLNAALAAMFGNIKRTGRLTDNKLGKAGIQHFTIHDLRRTLRTLLSSTGTPSHVAERCLNHKLKGLEEIYDRYDYLEERRVALQQVANILAPIINPDSNIVSFPRKHIG